MQVRHFSQQQLPCIRTMVLALTLIFSQFRGSQERSCCVESLHSIKTGKVCVSCSEVGSLVSCRAGPANIVLDEIHPIYLSHSVHMHAQSCYYTARRVGKRKQLTGCSTRTNLRSEQSLRERTLSRRKLSHVTSPPYNIHSGSKPHLMFDLIVRGEWTDACSDPARVIPCSEANETYLIRQQ